MKRTCSLFLAVMMIFGVVLAAPFSVSALAEDDVTATINDGTTTKQLDEVLDLEDSEELLTRIESYEVQVGGEEILSLSSNDSGVDTFLSANFMIPKTKKEVLLTGLTAQNAENIQHMLLSSYEDGTNFSLEDLDFIDAEKTRNTDEDDQLCWAAAAANTLVTSGWAAQAGFFDEDTLFEEIISHFSNAGSNADTAMGWFFNGIHKNQLIDSATAKVTDYPNSGAYFSDYAYDRLLEEVDITSNITDLSAVKRMVDALYEGKAITLGANVYNKFTNEELGGHALTVYGFIIDGAYSEDEADYYDTIILGDSDSDELMNDDRRNAKNVYTAYSLGMEDFSGGSKMFFSFSGYRFVLRTAYALTPYSDEVEKETDAAATKDKRTTPDIALKHIYLSADGNPTSLIDHFEEDRTIWFRAVFANLSDQTYSGQTKLSYVLKNSAGQVKQSESYFLNFSVSPCYRAYLNPDKLSDLPDDLYTLTVTVNSDKRNSEAYYYNNTLSVNFRVGAAPKTLILGDANLSGRVAIDDPTFIQMALAKLLRSTDDNVRCGDVNSNNFLDIADATTIQMYLAHFKLPVNIGGTFAA